MPMPSQDPLPQAIDFLSVCERCHKLVGDLWLINGEYVCNECYLIHKKQPQYNYKKVELEYSADSIKWKNIRGWSKWGGANDGLLSISTTWYCQACNDEQTIELPSYLIRIENQEFARICSVCLHIALERHINNIFDLMSVVKLQHPDF